MINNQLNELPIHKPLKKISIRESTLKLGNENIAALI